MQNYYLTPEPFESGWVTTTLIAIDNDSENWLSNAKDISPTQLHLDCLMSKNPDYRIEGLINLVLSGYITYVNSKQYEFSKRAIGVTLDLTQWETKLLGLLWTKPGMINVKEVLDAVPIEYRDIALNCIGQHYTNYRNYAEALPYFEECRNYNSIALICARIDVDRFIKTCSIVTPKDTDIAIAIRNAITNKNRTQLVELYYIAKKYDYVDRCDVCSDVNILMSVLDLLI
jgi:hypothetical protein